jgi:hypothetical protein
MESITQVALLSLAVFTLINLIRYIRGRAWNGAITIGTSWLGASVLAWLFSESRLGEDWVPPIGTELPLGQLGAADFIFVGLFLASGAQAFNEFNKARDNTESTAKPELLSGEPSV